MTIRNVLTITCLAMGLVVPAAALAQPGGDPNFAGSYYEIPDPAPPAPRYAPPPPVGSRPQAALQSPSQPAMPYAPASPPPPVVYAYPVTPTEWRRIERMRRRAWLCEHGYGCRGPVWR
jgi:hypothetical protein